MWHLSALFTMTLNHHVSDKMAEFT